MWCKILKGLLLSVIFLSLISSAQDPEMEKKKKKQRELDHIVVDTTIYSITRVPDPLLLEQKEVNTKLDSLLLEKQKKK